MYLEVLFTTAKKPGEKTKRPPTEQMNSIVYSHKKTIRTKVSVLQHWATI